MELIIKYLISFGMVILLRQLYYRLCKEKVNYSIFLYVAAFPYRGVIGLYAPELDLVIDVFLFAGFFVYVIWKKIALQPAFILFITGFITATILYAISIKDIGFIVRTPDTRFMLGMLMLSIFIFNSINGESEYYGLIKIFYYNAAFISILDILCRPFLNNYYGISEYMQMGRNHMAVYLFCGLFWGIYIDRVKRGVFSRNKIFSGIILFDILLLRSSSVYIMMLISFFIIVILSKFKLLNSKVLWCVCGSLVLAVSFLLYLTLSENGESNQIVQGFLRLKNTNDIFRLMIWKDALERFRDNMLFGIGSNNFRDRITNRNFPVHNDYFRLLAETGLVGFVCFVIFSYNVFQTSIKVKNQRDRTYLFAGCMAFYVFILFHGYINYLPFYIVTVLPFVSQKINRNKDKSHIQLSH